MVLYGDCGLWSSYHSTNDQNQNQYSVLRYEFLSNNQKKKHIFRACIISAPPRRTHTHTPKHIARTHSHHCHCDNTSMMLMSNRLSVSGFIIIIVSQTPTPVPLSQTITFRPLLSIVCVCMCESAPAGGRVSGNLWAGGR